MRYYIYKGSENSVRLNLWKDNFTVGKLYKGIKIDNWLKIKKSDQRGVIRLIGISLFEEASAIEVIVYFLLIGVKYLMLLLGIAAFIAALTGAYHQFYVSALAFLLYYLQTKKLL